MHLIYTHPLIGQPRPPISHPPSTYRYRPRRRAAGPAPASGLFSLFPFLSLRRSAPHILRQSHRPTRQPAGQPAPSSICRHTSAHGRKYRTPAAASFFPDASPVAGSPVLPLGLGARGAGRGLWGRAAALYGGPPPAGVVPGAMLVRLISREWKNDAGDSLSQTQDTAQQVGRP